MKFLWVLAIALLAWRLDAADSPVASRVTTVTINPREVTILHLRPEFESIIRMPEEVASVVLGSPSEFKAEHSEGEPDYVYVKPITREPAQSNLLIATKSGQQVTIELISDGDRTPNQTQPVDFLIEYRTMRSFLIPADSETFDMSPAAAKEPDDRDGRGRSESTAAAPLSALDEELLQQQKVNSPKWTRWPDQQIETSLGDLRQSSNDMVISYSILNDSDEPVEIVPPQIQIAGRKAAKRNKKRGKKVISDQLEIRDYRLSATRLAPGERADGVVAFERSNFKESTEMLFLQIAQANQVDRPVLIRLPFTPPISGEGK